MTIEELNKVCIDSFVEYLGLRFTEFHENEIKGQLEIKKHHLQPQGVVHGGVYISMAETLAGAGSAVLIGDHEKVALGNTISSQHLSSAINGTLFASAILIYESSFKHIWDVKITEESGKLISLSRVTNSIRVLNKVEE